MSYEKAQEAAEFIRSRYDREIKIALVLGSGLGAFADTLENAVKIPYEEIPHFARSTVEGHAGQLVLGEVGGVPIAVQQGRFHFYEGYEMSQVIFPMRVFGLLGIEIVILTNAAGSVRTSMKPGNVMLIRDHINLMGVNPLRGANDERFGARFPDMTAVYDKGLQALAYEEAQVISQERVEKGIDKEFNRFMWRGVYCALSGPTYETPAEIRMFRVLGADAVGMSTVPEVIAASHMQIPVLGISCITNMAAGILKQKLTHPEVMETTARVQKEFTALVLGVLEK